MIPMHTRIIAAASALLFATSIQAATPSIQESVQSMGEGAVKGYMQPFVTGLGVGMNSQWFYSSKAQSFLGLPIGISVYLGYPVTLVNKDMKTFTFSGSLPTGSLLSQVTNDSTLSLDNVALIASGGDTTAANQLVTDLQSDEVNINIKGVPTIYGSSKRKAVTLGGLLDSSGSVLATLVYSYNAKADSVNTLIDSLEALNITLPSGVQRLDTINTSDSLLLPFRGWNIPIAPTLPPVGVNFAITSIPILDNITVGARYIPTLSNSKMGSVGMLGYTIQHEVTPHIPILKSLPFIHLGVLYGYNRFSMDMKKVVKIESTNQVMMLTGSLDAKFLLGVGVYGGIGYEKSVFSVDVKSHDFGSGITTPAFDMEIEGKNKLRSQLGARVSFAVFDVYADANFGSTVTYNAGLAVGLNGL